MVTFLFSCSKDELPGNVTDESSMIQDFSLRSYNNGMIKSYSSETVLKWNELIGSLIDEKMPPPNEVKIYAMVTIAMHDALNNVVPVYETYGLDNTSVDASDVSKKNIKAIADAAVSKAARDVMVVIFPNSLTAADELLNTTLSAIDDEASKTKGLEIGKNSAEALLQKRSSDFPFLFTAYTASSDEPGVYQANFPPYSFPNPPIWSAHSVYAPNLGDLPPYGIASSDQFLDEAPYSVTSQEYANDYNEVKILGCVNCPDRTAEQTEIGSFWTEHTASTSNRIARTLILKYELNGWEAARLIALVEMSQIDSFIASFEEKDLYKFWAPLTAIWAGDYDGNPETNGDLTWTPRLLTPPVFEFSSTPAYGSGAASEIFGLFFKTDDISFEVTSPYYLPGVVRSFSSFSDYSSESSEARILLGHHFRHSVVVGERHGIELGRYVFENNLRELKKIK